MRSGDAAAMKPTLSRPLTGFFCWLGLVFAFAGVSEERASSCLTQKTVTTQCEAKLVQERNGINGRGPRSGKQTVYAGFELEQASLRTTGIDRLSTLLK